jgi:hypothetical protein
MQCRFRVYGDGARAAAGPAPFAISVLRDQSFCNPSL